ncbi:hypothetical protein D3C73_1486890 [compost metagenome]
MVAGCCATCIAQTHRSACKDILNQIPVDFVQVFQLAMQIDGIQLGAVKHIIADNVVMGDKLNKCPVP